LSLGHRAFCPQSTCCKFEPQPALAISQRQVSDLDTTRIVHMQRELSSRPTSERTVSYPLPQTLSTDLSATLSIFGRWHPCRLVDGLRMKAWSLPRLAARIHGLFDHLCVQQATLSHDVDPAAPIEWSSEVFLAIWADHRAPAARCPPRPAWIALPMPSLSSRHLSSVGSQISAATPEVSALVRGYEQSVSEEARASDPQPTSSSRHLSAGIPDAVPQYSIYPRFRLPSGNQRPHHVPLSVLHLLCQQPIASCA
jgi:hypothetical protein